MSSEELGHYGALPIKTYMAPKLNGLKHMTVESVELNKDDRTLFVVFLALNICIYVEFYSIFIFNHLGSVTMRSSPRNKQVLFKLKQRPCHSSILIQVIFPQFTLRIVSQHRNVDS